MRHLPAGKFKDVCLKTLDEVASARVPVVITKWGRPVARLVPVVSPASAAPRLTPEGRGAGDESMSREPIHPYRAGSGPAEAQPAAGTAASPAAPTGGEDAEGRLRRLAAEFGVPPETLLRRALDAYVGDDGLGAMIEAARRPVGAFRSGARHTARDHDEVLAEVLMDWR